MFNLKVRDTKSANTLIVSLKRGICFKIHKYEKWHQEFSEVIDMCNIFLM